jgi:hypothetical protein
MSAPCENELMDAIICAEGNAGVCEPCYGAQHDFKEEFEQDAENGFRKTLAFIPPQQAGFCDEANYRVCENQDENIVSSTLFRGMKYRETTVSINGPFDSPASI